MKAPIAAWIFPAIAVGAAVFVAVTCRSMPPLVASHFGSGGVPDGFMPRNVYVLFMLGFVIAMPVLMVYLTWFRMGRPGMSINLPHREHWMAPVRRDATIAYLRERVMQFGILLLSFLSYGHWLVIRANASRPVMLEQAWFLGGIAVFLVATLIWVQRLLGHFRKPE
jgi:Protein of unknown function (DUF1648)